MPFDTKEYEKLNKFFSTFIEVKEPEPLPNELTMEMLTDEMFIKMMYDFAKNIASPLKSESDIRRTLLDSMKAFGPHAIVLSNYMAIHLGDMYEYSRDMEPGLHFTTCRLFGLPSVIFHDYRVLPVRSILLIKSVPDSTPESFSIFFKNI